MGSKCPCCGSCIQIKIGIVHCKSKICWFRCNVEDLTRIAAAMELARELVKLERCEVIGPEYRRLEQSIAQMEYHVIEVFGGE